MNVVSKTVPRSTPAPSGSEEGGEDEADEPLWTGKLLGQSQRCGTLPPPVQPE